MNRDRVLLINPRIPPPVKSRKYNQAIPVSVPLSLGYLAGYMHSRGIACEIHDEQLEPLDEKSLGHLIHDQGYGVVGISTTTMFARRTMALAEMIKGISRDVTVILGGAHPTVLPEDCLRNQNIDIVVRREGESTLHELMRSFRGEMALGEIDGISYRDNGNVVHRPDRELLKDLDSLPPFPYHLFAGQRERYRFQVLSSRGCPHRCIFCSARSVSGHRVRYHGPERVVGDIRYLVNDLGIRRIAFADDTFTANRSHVQGICDLLVGEGLAGKAPLFCSVRGDMVDREMLEAMKRAGFQGVQIGIETGSDRLMEVIRKGETVGDNVRAVRLAREAGLKVRGTFLLGLPTETPEESRMTVRLALDLPLTFASFRLATPFPGTQLLDIAMEEGFACDDFSRYDVGGVTGREILYVPKGRDCKDLLALQKKAYFRFYARPRPIIDFLMSEIPDLNLNKLNYLDRAVLIARLFLAQFRS